MLATSCDTCEGALRSVTTTRFRMPTLLTYFIYTIPASGDFATVKFHEVYTTPTSHDPNRGEVAATAAGSNYSNQASEKKKRTGPTPKNVFYYVPCTSTLYRML